MQTMYEVEAARDLHSIQKAAFKLSLLKGFSLLVLRTLLMSGEAMCVTDIMVKLRVSESQASLYLNNLRRAKLVYVERDGKFMYYSPNMEEIRHVSDTLARFMRDWEVDKIMKDRKP